MAKYQIHRWDPLIVKNNNMPYPMIYIKPDKEFLDFAKENAYAILVKIEGTDTIYDGKHVIGTVGSLECDRPHMMNKTGLYTITLYAQWNGYPDVGKLGSAVVSGLKGPAPYKANLPPPRKFVAPKPIREMYIHQRTPQCKNNLNNTQVGSIAIGLLVLFGVLVWISHTTKKC